MHASRVSISYFKGDVFHVFMFQCDRQCEVFIGVRVSVFQPVSLSGRPSQALDVHSLHLLAESQLLLHLLLLLIIKDTRTTKLT